MNVEARVTGRLARHLKLQNALIPVSARPTVSW